MAAEVFLVISPVITTVEHQAICPGLTDGVAATSGQSEPRRLPGRRLNLLPRRRRHSDDARACNEGHGGRQQDRVRQRAKMGPRRRWRPYGDRVFLREVDAGGPFPRGAEVRWLCVTLTGG